MEKTKDTKNLNMFYALDLLLDMVFGTNRQDDDFYLKALCGDIAEKYGVSSHELYENYHNLV